LTGFFNDYDNLVTLRSGSAFFKTTPVPHLVIPLYFDNVLYGEVYGAEIAANWEVKKNWRLNAAYSYLTLDLHIEDTGTDDPDEEGRAPRNQFYLRSYYDLTDKLELDLSAKYIDNLPMENIQSYVRLDARLGWHIKEDMELSFVGQNLLDSKHQEFTSIKGS